MKFSRLILLMALSVSAVFARCQNDDVITKITFTSMTRGYQNEVFFTADSIIKIENNRGEEKISKRAIEPFEWEKLLNATTDLVPKDVPGLPSPSSKRTFDGARHSTITLATNSGESYTHSFDDENPHAKLVELMEAIRNVSGETQK